MARKTRVFIENVSQHIKLKSLDNLILFRENSDYKVFTLFLLELSLSHLVKIHAYILKPYYFEFLLTPEHTNSLSKFMQTLGKSYVSYYNKKYNHIGTLFDGRYKSSLIEDKVYLFDVMQYIEQEESKEYAYSSVEKNLLAKENLIVSFHPLYERKLYVKHCKTKLDKRTDDFIFQCLEKQVVTGSLEYTKKLEKLIGITLSSKNRGRPRKEIQEKRIKMYKNLVLLDKEVHKNFKISELKDLNFAKSTSFIPINLSELSSVGIDFPIVFTGDESPSIISIVSLGGESLAINNEGKWLKPYVPSHLRKYPFSIASTEDDPNKKVILIDEDSSLFSKSKGKQLFKKNHEHSETLDNAIKFLTSYEEQMMVAKNFAKVIADSGILEEREISIGEGDEKKVLVKGFKVIDKEKLLALEDKILALWVRKGIITAIDLHIQSLENIQKLFNIAHQRQN